MNNNGDFYALLFKMKNISRWGLMYNTRPENLSEHSFECAVLAHALALIGNKEFARNYQPEKLLSAALFHDMNEVLTGDLPTPVKYYNDSIKDAYKKIEKISEEKMLSLLDSDSQKEMLSVLSLTDGEQKIIKAADKLCAYIKCLQESERGNKEFAQAKAYNKKALCDFSCPELDFFIEHYLPSFTKNIDDVNL